jgi:hypothetical protein
MNSKLFLGASAFGLTAALLGQMSATAGSSRGGGGDGGTASAGADVIVGAIPNVSKYGSVVSGGQTIMAYAIGTTSCNIGTQPLEWFASPDNRHPFIPMNAFKYRNGRFEQARVHRAAADALRQLHRASERHVPRRGLLRPVQLGTQRRAERPRRTP